MSPVPLLPDDLSLKVIGVLVMVIGGYIANCLKELTKSVNKINVNLAVVITQQSNHGVTLVSHDGRISRLEERNV